MADGTIGLNDGRTPASGGGAVHGSSAPVVPSNILTTSCPDTTGIVAAISGFLAANHCLIGADLESVVLNRALKWYAERRVFRNGSKTVVLRFANLARAWE